MVSPDTSKPSGRRLVGDVAYSEAVQVASHVTPVPGGVGPMTVAMLMKNTVLAASRQLQRISTPVWPLQPLRLSTVSPPPRFVPRIQKCEVFVSVPMIHLKKDTIFAITTLVEIIDV